MSFISRVLLLLVGLVLFADVVRAQTVLDWSAPAACPDAVAVRTAIERAAGAQRNSVKIAAEVEPAGAGYALTLAIRTETGASRERLRASDCSLFVRLIALKVSLLASDGAVAPESSAAVSGSPAQPNRWSVRVQGVFATTPVPSQAFGVALGAGYQLGLLRLELGASYLFPRERSYAAWPEVGGAFHAWSTGMRACVSPWRRAFELAACGGVEAGLLRGQGFGVIPAKVSDQAFVLFGAGLSASASITALLAVRADVEALFGLVRPDFFVRNLGALHRVASVGMRGNLGVELRWW